jgi:hypothetical protein
MSESDANDPEKKLPIGDLICKLRKIESGFRQNLARLHQDLATLDSKPVFEGMAIRKKDAETRADDLEAEVKQLQDELRAIKELLHLDTESNTNVRT